MDKLPSPWGHVVLAVVVQVVLGLALLALGQPAPFAVAGIFPVAYFFGREVAQRESREAGMPVPMAVTPWWIGADMRRWHRGAIKDLVYPAVACIMVAVLEWLVMGLGSGWPG